MMFQLSGFYCRVFSILGFGVWGLGFRFRVFSILGFGVWGLGSFKGYYKGYCNGLVGSFKGHYKGYSEGLVKGPL